jgi:aspartate racemase
MVHYFHIKRYNTSLTGEFCKSNEVCTKAGVSRIKDSRIGILSGLGPLAGADLLSKAFAYAAERYGAVEDTEYPDAVLISHGIASFGVMALMDDQTESELLSVMRQLDQNKPTVIGIACNTAHLALENLRECTDAEVINIPVRTAEVAARQKVKYLLLSSRTTRTSGLYARALHDRGVDFVDVTDVQQDIIDEVIGLVMGNHITAAADILQALCQQYKTTTDGIIAGCTELPMAFDRLDVTDKVYIDANLVLAKSLVDACYQTV